MTRDDFLAALTDTLELAPGALTPDTVLAEVESWDSLAVISFIALVDEHFDQVVTGEQLARAKTIADLLALVEAKFA